MSKLRTLIVDDEPLALSLLRSKLSKLPEIEIIAECRNGREAVSAIMDMSPDLVFLDIQMPGVNGFGVIEKLQTDIVPLIVFITAYEQYAIEAFEVHAVDYILKPIDEERLVRAVQRASERFKTGGDLGNKSRIIGAIDTINEKSSYSPSQATNKSNDQVDKKIVVKDRGITTLLKQDDIEWVDAAGDYVCLHVDGVTHIKRSTLNNLQKDLDDSIFKRVHRSTIVNLNCIKEVIPHTKGEYFLKLGEFDQVKVSRNYREVIKNYLSDLQSN